MGHKNHKNKEGKLPTRYKKYKEYDAVKYIKGMRGKERFIVHHGKFGRKKIWYTNDHYKTFKRIK